MNNIDRKYTYRFLGFLVVMCLFTACVKDLNVTPINPQLNTENTAYKNSQDYLQGLAKLYASYALTGQQGAAGDGDLSSLAGSDEGNSGFLRVLWMAAESCTDEAICGWNDPGIPQLRNLQFTSQDAFANYVYYRVMFTVGICNQFLRDAADENLDVKGFSIEDKATVEKYRQEARFLRALAYYYGLDNFRNMPFVTEKDNVGAFFPKQATGQELYNYLVAELKDLVDNNLLPNPSANTYGRATTSAASALLAKLYLNAAVYLNPSNDQPITRSQANMDSVIIYCNKILDDGYSAMSMNSNYGNFSAYAELFMGDNATNPSAQKETIFAFLFDNAQSKSFNGTNFMINAAVGAGFDSTYLSDNFGIIGGWGGLRLRPTFFNTVFSNINQSAAAGEVISNADSRILFYSKTDGTFTIADPTLFLQGYSTVKFRAHFASQAARKGSTIFENGFYNTSFPVFRMADIYLMLAEAIQFGGQGGRDNALNYLNLVRNRAGATPLNALTPQDILNERGRELYYECWRRSDLIRFGQFTGNYTWEFKGGDNFPAGINVDVHYQIFPIPARDLNANSNLKQNPGY